MRRENNMNMYVSYSIAYKIIRVIAPGDTGVEPVGDVING